MNHRATRLQLAIEGHKVKENGIKSNERDEKGIQKVEFLLGMGVDDKDSKHQQDHVPQRMIRILVIVWIMYLKGSLFSTQCRQSSTSCFQIVKQRTSQMKLPSESHHKGNSQANSFTIHELLNHNKLPNDRLAWIISFYLQ